MPEKLAVDTASFGNSIWRKVGWNSFRHHILTLQRASNEVPSDPLVHSAAQWQAAHRESNDDARTLPFDVEQRLADDIAFLAAAEEGPKEVSAVVLEEQYGAGGLIIRLAANQSVPRGVEDTLRGMFDLLSRCSSRSICVQKLPGLALWLIVFLRTFSRCLQGFVVRPGHECEPKSHPRATSISTLGYTQKPLVC